jgi:hypothetical protein
VVVLGQCVQAFCQNRAPASRGKNSAECLGLAAVQVNARSPKPGLSSAQSEHLVTNVFGTSSLYEDSKLIERKR